jgi:hypothetical protein
MDPDANLKEQLELANDILEAIDRASDDGELGEEDKQDVIQDAERLAELVQSLHNWITGGGFLPKAWKKP